MHDEWIKLQLKRKSENQYQMRINCYDMYMNNISKFWCDWTTIFENWKSSTDPHMEFYASNNLHTKEIFHSITKLQLFLTLR